MEFLDPIFIGDFWQNSYLGNTVQEYVIAVVVFVVSAVVLKLIQVGILNRLKALAKKTATDIDDFLISIFESIRPAFYVLLSLYFALRYLSLSDTANKIFTILLLVVIVWQTIRIVGVGIDYGVRKKFEGDKGGIGAARFLSGIAKAILWLVGLLLILQNAGVNVTSLIAGMGIGGIAIAFAVQGILEDLFSSFAIFFDKPFVVGDRIVVGQHRGRVEKIGIKTTRIRSAQGEQVIISNKELTSSQVVNSERAKELRASILFGVVYEIPQDLLESIPKLVTDVIDDVEGTRSHRVHFLEFGDSALNFKVTFFVDGDNRDQFMDKRQEVNFAIRRVLTEKGIEFAYPTQTIYQHNVKK